MHKRKLKKHVVTAITAAKEIFDKNQADDNTANDVAAAHQISRNVLQKSFKEEFGLGIREYKMKRRMELGRQLLADGKDAKAISIILHYSNPSAFNNAFKRYWGVTPKEMFDFSKEGIAVERQQGNKQ
ncbi:helix-turn-helix transcriptional regulator [Niastella caeni]|uniref:Helix-turn-helix transcriptional regulator n=1 Tax=Niastella caeni TaxID=2569763 RepID=A0A4S8HFN3_9BACT|nr:AraC family transcriptional regulator [Niastella caeni]THU32929.1 helix-turn-helix transcriptional regulator [Niastella caeni]